MANKTLEINEGAAHNTLPFSRLGEPSKPAIDNDSFAMNSGCFAFHFLSLITPSASDDQRNVSKH